MRHEKVVERVLILTKSMYVVELNMNAIIIIIINLATIQLLIN